MREELFNVRKTNDLISPEANHAQIELWLGLRRSRLHAAKTEKRFIYKQLYTVKKGFFFSLSAHNKLLARFCKIIICEKEGKKKCFGFFFNGIVKLLWF